MNLQYEFLKCIVNSSAPVERRGAEMGITLEHEEEYMHRIAHETVLWASRSSENREQATWILFR